MADKDEVKIGDIVEVIVEKKVTGKLGESLEQQGHSNPNRLGQKATVSGVQQISKKDGKSLSSFKNIRIPMATLCLNRLKVSLPY